MKWPTLNICCLCLFIWHIISMRSKLRNWQNLTVEVNVFHLIRNFKSQWNEINYLNLILSNVPQPFSLFVFTNFKFQRFRSQNTQWKIQLMQPEEALRNLRRVSVYLHISSCWHSLADRVKTWTDRVPLLRVLSWFQGEMWLTEA